MAPAAEPHLAFTANCLRRPLTQVELDEIACRAHSLTDWLQVLRWTARHRVTSLVYDALRQLPSDIMPPAILEELRRDAQARAAVSMRQISEAQLLVETFAAVGIRNLILKGPVLSVLAFGDPLLRDGRDLDILVEPERLDDAEAILRANGYTPLKPTPELPPRRRKARRRWVHDRLYRSPTGLLLELAERLHPTASLLPLDLAREFARPQIVAVAGHALPTLPTVELFLYLCTHGSRHGWFRLKWLADIAALANRLAAGELQAVVQRAKELGVERSLYEALLLCDAWLAAPVPALFRDAARADRAAHRRAAAASRLIATMGPDGNPFAQFGFAARLDWNEIALRPEWSYRWAVLRRHGLSRLYRLLRPARGRRTAPPPPGCPASRKASPLSA